MIHTPHPRNQQSLPASLWPLRRALGGGLVQPLLAFGAGFVLGGLYNYWAWQWLENPWPFFGWLCPPLLGLMAGLLDGGGRRHAWLHILATSLLAWSGFVLTFLVIAHIHWDQEVFPYVPPPTPEDPTCSPCLDFNPSIPFSLQGFFVIGLLFVTFIAGATNVVVRVVRWVSTRRPAPPSHSS